MSPKLHLALVIACTAIVSTLAAPQASSLTSDSVRFSRLLSKQPDILRFTSISNLGPASPVLEPQFQSVYNAQQQQQQQQTNQPKKATGLSSEQFLRRTENLGDDALLITKAEPGQEYVYIHQEIKQGNDAKIPTESLTSLNQKPTARKPFALLRQSAGNKLNISPVFPDSNTNARNPLKGNSQTVSVLSDISNQDESSDATTTSPFISSADEEAEAVTIESLQEDDVPVTTFPPTQEKKGRMIINVVTSAPRFEVENSTTPATPRISTTVIPKAKPQERPAQAENTSEDDENLVVDAFHRNGHFPDFEDSPAHLHTAESNQPARVNVRPASSGKDYEYEYIYYYYDDEDDDNSTTKKVAGDSHGAVSTKITDDAAAAAVESNNSFDAEKISVANVPTNSLDSPVVSRGQKAIVDEAAGSPQAQESIEEVAQVTTVLPETLRTRRPNSVNRPIVLKHSNMSPATVETPVATTPTRRIITTTTTTSAPPTESSRSRLRFKSRTEATAVNNAVRPTEETSEAPAATPSRRPFKDNQRRRNPSRRVNAAQQPSEAPVEEQVAPVQVAPAPVQEEQPTRLPIRTRFPPRVSTTTTTEAVIVPATEAAQVASQEVASSPIQSVEVQSPVSIESDRKAKDNYARQKSINDLYAHTRLHQLAINTRIPNRKTDHIVKGTSPKLAAGFINSAEQTTKFTEEAIASNEATTFASAFPSAASAELSSTEHVQQTLAPTTTTTTTTEAAPERGPGKQRAPGGNRFRPRGNRLNAAATAATAATAEGPSSSTTETAPSRAPSPNRFGRRRFSTTVAPDAAPSAATVTENEQRPVSVRTPSRNRFSGRTRPTTSTTEATEAVAGEQEGQEIQRPQAPRRRPSNFQGRRRQQSSTPQSQSTGQSDDAESPASPVSSASPATTAARPRSNSESERRRFNFGNPARNRPSGPGVERPRPLIRGGRTSTTEAPEVQAEQENPEPIVSEQVSVSETEVQAEKPESNQDEPAPVVSVSSTTSSSVSSDVLVNKKGSAAVLGRLRSRTKPIQTTTTIAPEVAVAAERKPSRLSGILNRRKLGSQPTPAAVKEEPVHEEHDLSPEHEELQRKGVVVQVSSTVTESEEVGDNLEHESDQSSTTHVSLLNRLKSQRKPGQIYRKAPSSSSE